jgi:hypothetical protein
VTTQTPDPKDLPVALPLQPDNALQGCDIQVVGNALRMKNTIGRGVIGRINCSPPRLDSPEGQDLNIDYIALAMSAPGGSSGTLAFNINGEGVALMCSSDEVTMAYMPPVHLPKKALHRLQEDKPVMRGSLHTKWELRPLNECWQLGLDSKWSDELRRHRVCNAVCAEAVLPEGPLDDEVAVDDILLQMDDELVKSLRELELKMDLQE